MTFDISILRNDVSQMVHIQSRNICIVFQKRGGIDHIRACSLFSTVFVVSACIGSQVYCAVMLQILDANCY